MRKFIITAELRDLENQVHSEEISYSRMVEILCEKADVYAQNKFLEKIDNAEEVFVWRILHIPTGLFYTSVKGRWKDTKTNLSKKGTHYSSEKIVTKVLKQVENDYIINEAQSKKFNLDVVRNWDCNIGRAKDLIIKEYKLIETR